MSYQGDYAQNNPQQYRRQSSNIDYGRKDSYLDPIQGDYNLQYKPEDFYLKPEEFNFQSQQYEKFPGLQASQIYQSEAQSLNANGPFKYDFSSFDNITRARGQSFNYLDRVKTEDEFQLYPCGQRGSFNEPNGEINHENMTAYLQQHAAQNQLQNYQNNQNFTQMGYNQVQQQISQQQNLLSNMQTQPQNAQYNKPTQKKKSMNLTTELQQDQEVAEKEEVSADQNINTKETVTNTQQNSTQQFPPPFYPFGSDKDSLNKDWYRRFIDTNNIDVLKNSLPKDFMNNFNLNMEDVLQNPMFSNHLQNSSPQKRIGPLTVEERKAKIAKYLEKRKKRTWNKKINYDCRKRVADSRLRVKGRFVTKSQAFNMLGDLIGNDNNNISNQDLRALLIQKFGGFNEKDGKQEGDPEGKSPSKSLVEKLKNVPITQENFSMMMDQGYFSNNGNNNINKSKDKKQSISHLFIDNANYEKLNQLANE